MSQFLMPSLGADMTSGTLVEQSIAAGDAFHRGDVIAAVETQKGVIEVEVFEDGILERWLVDLGTEVPVGTPLALLAQEDEPKPAQPEIPPEPEPPARPDTPELPPVPTPTPVPAPPPETVPIPPDIQPPIDRISTTTSSTSRSDCTRPKITPAARRFAKKSGINISDVSHTAGQIVNTRNIAQSAATSEKSRDGPKLKTDASAEMRNAIAAAMTRSKQEIPHYYLTHEVDLGAADAHLTKTNADRAPSERLLMGALSTRAIALALNRFPEFNGHYGADGFQPSGAVHLGIAINLRTGGLVAPALLDAEKRSADELMQGLSDLVARVRAGRFKARELSDATITLTSLGARGIDQVIGVIYPPQVAIVGIGTPRLKPTVYEDKVTARLSATLSLAADHRVSDGHRGAIFLKAIDALLQEPENL